MKVSNCFKMILGEWKIKWRCFASKEGNYNCSTNKMMMMMMMRMMMMMMMPLVQKYVWFEDKIRISWSFQEQVMFLEDVIKICRWFTEHLMRTSGEKHCFLETSILISRYVLCLAWVALGSRTTECLNKRHAALCRPMLEPQMLVVPHATSMPPSRPSKISQKVKPQKLLLG